jgi:hypothetical protein
MLWKKKSASKLALSFSSTVLLPQCSSSTRKLDAEKDFRI